MSKSNPPQIFRNTSNDYLSSKNFAELAFYLQASLYKFKFKFYSLSNGQKPGQRCMTTYGRKFRSRPQTAGSSDQDHER